MTRIGLFGGGVVGGGFYELFSKFQQNIELCNPSHSIVKICVRDIHKSRDFTISKETLLVSDPLEILEDPNIDCIVELIGGITVAKDIIYHAIKSNKHVVTANKALIATYLSEIIDLLREHPTVQFGYEAAVCGGIPIINTLQTTYFSDIIHSVRGIMNGTTNFILTKMETDGANYHDVLREAQMLGYAEADPTADVEGFDVQNTLLKAKISLLSKLAFGIAPSLSSIPIQGITAITAFAKSHNWTIKLLGTASYQENHGLSVYVTPTLVPLTSLIGQTTGPNNIVIVESNNLQQSVYIGPGAGRYPTANSVFSDVLRIIQHQCPQPFPKHSQLPFTTNYSSNFYIRITSSPSSDQIEPLEELLEKIHTLANQKQLLVTFLDKIHSSLVMLSGVSSNETVQEFCDEVIKLLLLSQPVKEDSSPPPSVIYFPILS